jgi:hypothetical protein
LAPHHLIDTDSGGGANNLHIGDVNDIHSCTYAQAQALANVTLFRARPATCCRMYQTSLPLDCTSDGIAGDLRPTTR